MLSKARFGDTLSSGALWVFVAQLGLLVGLEAVFIAAYAGSADFIASYHEPSLATIGVATSLYPICAAIGAISVLYFVVITQELTLLIISVVFWYVGYVVAIVASGNLAALMAVRVVKGLGIGILTSVLPIYVENVSESKRQAARVLTLFQAAVPLGILMMALVAQLSSPSKTFAQKWTLAAIPVFPIGLVIFLLPPKKTADIINCDKQQQLIDELSMSAWARVKMDCCTLARSRSAVMRCAAATLAQCAPPLTAINVVFYYSSNMCKMAGFDDLTGEFLALGLYACNFVGTAVSLLYINRLPRLETLKYSCLCIAVLHIVLYTVLLIQQYIPQSDLLGILAIGLLFLLVAIFASLLAGISLVYTSEVVSPKSRGISIGIATALGWLCNFLISLASSALIPCLGCYLFLAFAYLCLCMFVVFGIMPSPGPK